jgi:hypothetical protein
MLAYFRMQLKIFIISRKQNQSRTRNKSQRLGGEPLKNKKKENVQRKGEKWQEGTNPKTLTKGILVNTMEIGGIGLLE